MSPMPKGKAGQYPGPMKADGSFDWVTPPNRCPTCGKKLTGETVRDERDADALCWCPDDDATCTTSPRSER